MPTLSQSTAHSSVPLPGLCLFCSFGLFVPRSLSHTLDLSHLGLKKLGYLSTNSRSHWLKIASGDINSITLLHCFIHKPKPVSCPGKGFISPITWLLAAYTCLWFQSWELQFLARSHSYLLEQHSPTVLAPWTGFVEARAGSGTWAITGKFLTWELPRFDKLKQNLSSCWL